MMVDDIRAACGREPQVYSGDSDPELDLRAFRDLDIPALCIGLPPATAMAVLAADGSVALIEHGHITSEFDGKIVEAADLLKSAAAQEMALDFFMTRDLDDRLVPMVGSFVQTFCLLDATRGARTALGLAPDAALASVAETARAGGGDPSDVNAALDALGQGLEDPLFAPQDHKTWGADAEAELESVLLDILASDRNFNGGEIQLRCANEEDAACIDGYLTHDQARRALDLLEVLVDLSDRFSGISWEYNDGAGSRKSGFYPTGVALFDAEVDAFSEHERLAAWGRLSDRLAAAGKSPDEIRDLLEP